MSRPRAQPALPRLPLLLLPLLLLPLPVPLAGAEDGLVPASDLHRVIDARITPRSLPTLLEGQSSATFTLPQLWVYDREGRELMAQEGFSVIAFLGSLETTLTSPTPNPEAPTLASRLEHFVTPGSEPLDTLPAADLTVVKYWADWCQPCRQQSKLLGDFLARHPETRIHVLQVETDPAKLSQIPTIEVRAGEGDKTPGSAAPSAEAPPLRGIRGKVDAEALEKLQSGELSPEELEALMEKIEEGEAPDTP